MKDVVLFTLSPTFITLKPSLIVFATNSVSQVWGENEDVGNEFG